MDTNLGFLFLCKITKSGQAKQTKARDKGESGSKVDTVSEGGKKTGTINIPISKFTAKDVPSVRNGEFNKFFNSLSVDELDTLWKNKEIREVIEARLRSPGGLHEWHLVARATQFKYWGVSAE